MILQLPVVSTEVTWWYLVSCWAGLGWAGPEGPRCLQSHVWHFAVDSQRAGLSWAPLAFHAVLSEPHLSWSLPRQKLPVLVKARPGIDRVSFPSYSLRASHRLAKIQGEEKIEPISPWEEYQKFAAISM